MANVRLTLELPRFSFWAWFVQTLLRIYLRPTITGGKLMYIVKTDNPDVAYQINKPEVTDSEGNKIPEAQLDVEVLTDNPDAVDVISDAGNLTGKIHFGNPGQANINVNISSGGTLLGALGAQFTTTVGDPAKILGGSITFEGLTEAAPPPPPPEGTTEDLGQPRVKR